jgi:hypothetical protein
METTINYNGTEIILYGNYVGTATPWGEKYVKQHFEIDVTINNRTVTFDFYCNDSYLDDEQLCEAFYYFLSDGISYDNARDVDDFQSEFGYEKVSECLEAYNGCKDSFEQWKSITDIDIYEIANWLQDKYNF